MTPQTIRPRILLLMPLLLLLAVSCSSKFEEAIISNEQKSDIMRTNKSELDGKTMRLFVEWHTTVQQIQIVIQINQYDFQVGKFL